MTHKKMSTTMKALRCKINIEAYCLVNPKLSLICTVNTLLKCYVNSAHKNSIIKRLDHS